ncbi:MAG: hypothetical protein ACOX8S_07785 [Christensenellales bacterium]
MKTTYLIWKDPACGGISPELQEITDKEFYALVNTDAGKNRHFIAFTAPSRVAPKARS